MNTVYLAWREPGRRWFAVGALTRAEGTYTFSYTHGAEVAAEEAAFQPLPGFPDLRATYHSDILFPVFRNRLLSEKRPEFPEFATWLNTPANADPLILLARSAGRRETDTFEVFARPEPDEHGGFRVQCFIHGLNHREPAAIARAAKLWQGEPLRVEPEPDNAFDSFALKTLTTGEQQHIGYLPRYLTPDLHVLGVGNVSVHVERMNPPPAPIQFRVLCRVTAAWPPGFQACASPEFEPIAAATPPS